MQHVYWQILHTFQISSNYLKWYGTYGVHKTSQTFSHILYGILILRYLEYSETDVTVLVRNMPIDRSYIHTKYHQTILNDTGVMKCTRLHKHSHIYSMAYLFWGIWSIQKQMLQFLYATCLLTYPKDIRNINKLSHLILDLESAQDFINVLTYTPWNTHFEVFQVFRNRYYKGR